MTVWSNRFYIVKNQRTSWTYNNDKVDVTEGRTGISCCDVLGDVVLCYDVGANRYKYGLYIFGGNEPHQGTGAPFLKSIGCLRITYFIPILTKNQWFSL